eukprot:2941675-Pleurochrysis_carterae.AAC.4
MLGGVERGAAYSGLPEVRVRASRLVGKQKPVNARTGVGRDSDVEMVYAGRWGLELARKEHFHSPISLFAICEHQGKSKLKYAAYVRACTA